MSTPYLTEEEIPKYCTIIDGVTAQDVAMATDLIDSYLGRSYAPQTFKDRITINKHGRGKLPRPPIIEIKSVKAIVRTPFGH